MSIRLAPSIEAQITRHVERGSYPNADAVMEEALRLLRARDDEATLRELIQEGLDQAARGERIPMSESFWSDIEREAEEEDGLGLPIPDHVKP